MSGVISIRRVFNEPRAIYRSLGNTDTAQAGYMARKDPREKGGVKGLIVQMPGESGI